MLYWIAVNIYILVSAFVVYREVKYKQKDALWVVIYLVLSELFLAVMILSNVNHLLGGAGL